MTCKKRVHTRFFLLSLNRPVYSFGQKEKEDLRSISNEPKLEIREESPDETLPPPTIT